MKKISTILSALALAAGCTVSTVGTDDVLRSSPVFTANFESPNTRVYVDGDLKLHWSKDDRISVFTSTYNDEYKFNGSTGDKNGAFTPLDDEVHSGNDIPAVYAVYPYSPDTSVDSDGVVFLSLPEVQTYAADSFGNACNTMVAVTESKSSRVFEFKNLCGFVVIRLYGNATIKSISLTGNNGEKLAGTASVTAVYGQPPKLRMSEQAAESITLDCGDGVTLGKTADEATAFWFAIPPVTFSNGFTVRITDADQLSMKKSVSAERRVVRNIVNTMVPLEVSGSNSYIEFADANFKAYCVLNFDKDGDGEISFAEAPDITYIHAPSLNIASLGGIEHFVNLTYLNCSDNQLSSLDLSNCTQLATLKCSDNQLTSLGLSNCTQLATLNCSDNQLTDLDISCNTQLTSLDCFSNRLTSLDLSNNTQLTSLYCYNNQLSRLDISNCTQLTTLKCFNNQLTSLDISCNTQLTGLGCDNNLLSSLDLSNNTQLTSLGCSDNQLTSLDLSDNAQLTWLECYSNLLSSLNLSNCTQLTTLGCSDNQLTSLDLSDNAQLTYLYCKNNLLSSLDVSNNTQLTWLDCRDNQHLSEICLKTGQTIPTFYYDSNVTITIFP